MRFKGAEHARAVNEQIREQLKKGITREEYEKLRRLQMSTDEGIYEELEAAEKRRQISARLASEQRRRDEMMRGVYKAKSHPEFGENDSEVVFECCKKII